VIVAHPALKSVFIYIDRKLSLVVLTFWTKEQKLVARPIAVP
jgi:hypothetical protein